MNVRRFEPADAPSVCEIYYRSVHEVASAKYDRDQLDAWAPRVPDHVSWLPRLCEYVTFVADDDAGNTIGWIAMSPTGYVDMLFCLPEATRCGVASELYSNVEQAAIALGLTELTAHASLFAQSFFARHGWETGGTEVVVRNDVEIQRAVMSKRLPS
jgi:putative acetyltransferase